MTAEEFVSILEEFIRTIVQCELKSRAPPDIPPAVQFPSHFPSCQVERLTKEIEELVSWERSQVFEICAKLVEDEDGWCAKWFQNPDCPQVSSIDFIATLENIATAIRKKAKEGVVWD